MKREAPPKGSSLLSWYSPIRHQLQYIHILKEAVEFTIKHNSDHNYSNRPINLLGGGILTLCHLFHL